MGHTHAKIQQNILFQAFYLVKCCTFNSSHLWLVANWNQIVANCTSMIFQPKLINTDLTKYVCTQAQT